MDLELPPLTAQDDAAPTAVHVVTPALSRHSRRFAARQRHLQRAIKAAAADGTGGPDDTEHARGGAAWATLGDTISPGCGQWPEGGWWGWCGRGGERFEHFFNSYLHAPLSCPPPCHSRRRPADHPRPARAGRQPNGTRDRSAPGPGPPRAWRPQLTATEPTSP